MSNKDANIPAFLRETNPLGSHYFTQENMGSVRGFSYADVYDPMTGKLKPQFTLVGYHKQGNAFEVMIETEDGTWVFFHHRDL